MHEYGTVSYHCDASVSCSILFSLETVILAILLFVFSRQHLARLPHLHPSTPALYPLPPPTLSLPLSPSHLLTTIVTIDLTQPPFDHGSNTGKLIHLSRAERKCYLLHYIPARGDFVRLVNSVYLPCFICPAPGLTLASTPSTNNHLRNRFSTRLACEVPSLHSIGKYVYFT